MIILKVEDTLESIFETLRIVAQELKNREKLIIVDFSNLRSIGNRTDTVGITSGVVSFIKVYDSGIAPVQKDSKVCCVLSVKHPEIERLLLLGFQNILTGVIVESSFIEAMKGDIVNFELIDPFSKSRSWILVSRLSFLLAGSNIILFQRIGEKLEELKEMGKIEFLGLQNRCPECKGQMSPNNSVCLDCGYSSCKG